MALIKKRIILVIILVETAVALLLCPAAFSHNTEGTPPQESIVEKYVTSASAEWQGIAGGERQYVYSVKTNITGDAWNKMTAEEKDGYAQAITKNKLYPKGDDTAVNPMRCRVIGYSEGGQLLFMGTENTIHIFTVKIDREEENHV
jgi:hypothetical protein